MLMAFISLLVGCTTTQLPYIEKTILDKDIIIAEDPYQFKFYIYNPTVNTFVGSVNFTYDKRCWTATGGDSNPIEIEPKGNRALAKEFVYKGRQYIREGFYRIEEVTGCLQTPLEISMILSDRSGETRDSEKVFVTITK